MAALLFAEAGAQYFLLITARVGAMMLAAPFWSHAVFPVTFRVFVPVVVAAVLLPVIWPGAEAQAVPLTWYALFVARELLLGLVIGMAASVLFYAVQVAGQVVDTQMGFGMVNVMDPATGAQIPILGNFFYLLATVLFVVVDGHHHLLQGLYSSFQIIPLGGAVFPQALWEDLGMLMGQMLVIAVRIALPLSGVLFLADLSLGIIARTVPQMNVFILGIPSKILIGFFVLSLVLPVYAWLLRHLFDHIFQHLDLLLLTLEQAG